MQNSFRNRGWWFAAVALAVVGLLMTCSGCHSRFPANEPAKFADQEEHLTLPYAQDIYVFRLADGTRCAAIDSSRGTALSCEWKYRE